MKFRTAVNRVANDNPGTIEPLTENAAAPKPAAKRKRRKEEQKDRAGRRCSSVVIAR